MDFGEYQKESKKTDLKVIINNSSLAYLTLGLSDEAGEVAGKIKKLYRDKNGVLSEEYKKEIVKELGDVLWYLTQISTNLGVTLEEVAQTNIEKLKARQEKNKLTGNGDNR
jgi:NTP pyrophosphatase (non-canonical NTP hydrolase)